MINLVIIRKEKNEYVSNVVADCQCRDRCT